MSGRYYTSLNNPQRRQQQNIGADFDAPSFFAGAAIGIWGILWWACAILCLLMFAFSVSGAGVAWYLYAHRGEFYSWNAVGQVSQSGGLTSVLTQCTNLTFSTGSKAVKKHKNVTFYNTCPQPRSTCEIALCGGDGICYFELADGAQCSSNQDCTDLYNSTAYTCGSDCLCTNSSQASFAFIKFTPANVTTSRGTYDPVTSYYFYRAIGDVIEIEIQLVNGNVNLTADHGFTFTLDISNLPYALINTATEYGVGYGSIVPSFYGPTTEVFGFLGIEGYTTSSTQVAFDIDFDASLNVDTRGILFNGRFVGRFT